MRAKRAKQYRKALQHYQQFCGFREPYQLLVSPDFVLEAASKSVDIVETVSQTLGAEVRPLITFCGIDTVRKAEGEHRDKAVAAIRGFEKRRCPHTEPIAGAKCIEEILGGGNKHHYVLAAQSEVLRAKLRRIVGVPILHMKQVVVVMEPVPEHTRALARPQESAKQELSGVEREMLKTLKAETRAAKAAARPSAPKRKKKGPKGPNPLSAKKSKKK
ncbi:hypothetical protein IWQ56_001035 [Coemansia nantahalensis]|uniref:Uncharacterized protein n=1 Tax=Coemansia helicoidea TaxID=1286919 RepID=A0ACC1LEN8_9FUNG|nr:hypothetical protein IWQ56_001035 [Coemansia nantahalensis]KAJ2806058.1 hypothetical protein H4R21_001028 [Coemansia helicoidea]